MVLCYYVSETGDVPLTRKIIYCRTEVKLPFESRCVFSVWCLVWVFFLEEGFSGFIWFFCLVGFVFYSDVVHLSEVCTIPAGLATFSIVFVGLQTSTLCFPYVIFILSFDSKIQCLFKLTYEIYETTLFFA